MTKWMIWPRQYGKTYQIRKWWLEDPQNRAIVTLNEQSARNLRHDLKEELTRRSGGLFSAETDRVLRQRVMSWRSWDNCRGESWRSGCEVAVDEAGHVLASILLADVRVVAGTGNNEEPDPVQAHQVQEFMRKTHTEDWTE